MPGEGRMNPMWLSWVLDPFGSLAAERLGPLDWLFTFFMLILSSDIPLHP
jgi:hypothetical protein